MFAAAMISSRAIGVKSHDDQAFCRQYILRRGLGFLAPSAIAPISRDFAAARWSMEMPRPPAPVTAMQFRCGMASARLIWLRAYELGLPKPRSGAMTYRHFMPAGDRRPRACRRYFAARAARRASGFLINAAGLAPHG